MNETVITIGSIITTLTVIGGIFTIVRELRSARKDQKTEGKEEGVIENELKHIRDGISDLNKKMDEQNGQILGLVERVTKSEEQIKAIHQRLNILEERK